MFGVAPTAVIKAYLSKLSDLELEARRIEPLLSTSTRGLLRASLHLQTQQTSSSVIRLLGGKDSLASLARLEWMPWADDQIGTLEMLALRFSSSATAT